MWSRKRECYGWGWPQRVLISIRVLLLAPAVCCGKRKKLEIGKRQVFVSENSRKTSRGLYAVKINSAVVQRRDLGVMVKAQKAWANCSAFRKRKCVMMHQSHLVSVGVERARQKLATTPLQLIPKHILWHHKVHQEAIHHR